MSTTATKRSLAAAMTDAANFRALFPVSSYARWQIAGSARRRTAEVSDVEHVVIPRFGEVVDGSGLFTTTRTANLLWERLDELVRTYALIKHSYGDAGSHRWGEKYRGVDYRGFCHEIFCADADNWGSTLAIRTGPGSFSKMLVNALQRHGYCNSGGYVLNKSDMSCSLCGWRGCFAGGDDGLARYAAADWPTAEMKRHGDPEKPQFANGTNEAGVCPQCVRQIGLSMARVSVPDERKYFELCGMRWLEPEQRREVAS